MLNMKRIISASASGEANADIGDGAPTAPRCLVTGQDITQNNRLRFALAPDGTLVPDLAEKLPAPVFFLCGEKRYLHQAIETNVFAKAAGRAVHIAPQFAEQLDALLSTRALEQLGLARRQGALVAGFTKVDKALRNGTAKLVIIANDAAADGRQKITQLAAGQNVAVLAEWPSAALSKALGRENVVHLAVTEAGCASGVAQKVKRLTLYRYGA